MKDQILKELNRLEKERDITILLAVESGSRAWGFESTNSDWDVRFIYLEKPEQYLKIDDFKDNMEEMRPLDIDLAGWELRKTLKLFRKSNPPLLEWLQSPLVYLEKYSTADELRALSKTYFNLKSCSYHYLSMAKNNFEHYLRSDVVRLKKYFYVLRPVLACRWIESKKTMAPMEFNKLIETQIDDPKLRIEIEQLQEIKMSGKELDKGPRIDRIHDFIESEIERFSELIKTYDTNHELKTERLDEVFRSALKEVYQIKY
ncbi:nucleotidyltransferase domain-containing protein [bacterium]|nr:nucleotidyltransferase domain-containing protein [bacterium]